MDLSCVDAAQASKQRRAVHWLDAGVLIGHYIFWIGLPLFFFPAINVLLVYFIRNAIAGYGMFALFAVPRSFS